MSDKPDKSRLIPFDQGTLTLVWCEVKALKRTVADLERRLRRLETLFKVAELMTE